MAIYRSSMLVRPYKVNPGDSPIKIARKFGYQNAGPITTFPRNKKLMKEREYFHPGDVLYIPWNPNQLKKLKSSSQKAIQHVIQRTNKIVGKLKADKKDIDGFLLSLDIISYALTFVVTIAAGATGAAIKASKETAGAAVATKTCIDSEIIIALIDKAGSLAGLGTTAFVNLPEKPSKDINYYLRHATGLLNPSYYASIGGAIKEGDLNIWLYGSSHVFYKNATKIKNNAMKEIDNLKTLCYVIDRQRAMPFYRNII